jgi:hypothetical protein
MSREALPTYPERLQGQAKEGWLPHNCQFHHTEPFTVGYG